MSSGDTHLAVARGSRATVVVDHNSAFGTGPQVFVIPDGPNERSLVLAGLRRHCNRWSLESPGYEVNETGDSIHVCIPDRDRTGHEAHFASVLGEFVNYFHNRDRIPTWERPNLLAKYYLTTRATVCGLPK